MNYLTTLLDLCVDDKTAQTEPKQRRNTRQAKQRVSQNRVITVLARELRTKTRTGNSVTRVFNTGSQADTKNKTWEASTLTGVLREQTRRDKKKQPASLINVLSSQHGSQRCGNVTNSGRIFTKMLKQTMTLLRIEAGPPVSPASVIPLTVTESMCCPCGPQQFVSTIEKTFATRVGNKAHRKKGEDLLQQQGRSSPNERQRQIRRRKNDGAWQPCRSTNMFFLKAWCRPVGEHLSTQPVM